VKRDIAVNDDDKREFRRLMKRANNASATTPQIFHDTHYCGVLTILLTYVYFEMPPRFRGPDFQPGVPGAFAQTIAYIISRLNTALRITDGKCLQFSGAENGGHFERRAAIGRRNTPHHNYIGVHARKLTGSCLRTYC